MDEPVAVIVRRVGRLRGFLVRVEPSGTEFWARSWSDLEATLPEVGVKYRNVRFESDAVRQEIRRRWGPQSV
jgi:hypothetical protein